jgi:hypothetical protein
VTAAVLGLAAFVGAALRHRLPHRRTHHGLARHLARTLALGRPHPLTRNGADWKTSARTACGGQHPRAHVLAPDTRRDVLERGDAETDAGTAPQPELSLGLVRGSHLSHGSSQGLAAGLE